MCENDSLPRITPIKVKPEMRIKILSDEDVEKIHQATLNVLEEVGVKFPSEKALKIFAEAGAKVDFKSQIVKIPSDLLMNSLSKAPRSYIFASREDRNLDLYFDGTKTYFGTDGTGTATIDLETRQRRTSTKKDVEMMAIISDYLSSISFYCALVSAQDVPSKVIPLHELEAGFVNTEKHIQTETTEDERVARYAVEMAKTIAGGSEALKKRPVLDCFVCTIAPLRQDKGGIESALVFAEAGIPVGFMAMPSLGITAPASMASAMVIGNAEIISAMCLIQIAYPGAPVYYSFIPGVGNPYTGGFVLGAPQKTVLNAAGIQVGHYYNVPVMSGAFGATDAHEPDSWQAGMEVSRGPLSVCLTGADFSVGLGLLEAYTLLYPEKILFDNEIFNVVKTVTEGVKVDAETLALDEIAAVGPGGHFLGREYTRKKLRELWQPGILHQWSPEKRGFLEPQEAAIEKVKWILKNHKPKPLDDKVKEELKRILKAAEKELCS